MRLLFTETLNRAKGQLPHRTSVLSAVRSLTNGGDMSVTHPASIVQTHASSFSCSEDTGPMVGGIRSIESASKLVKSFDGPVPRAGASEVWCPPNRSLLLWKPAPATVRPGCHPSTSTPYISLRPRLTTDLGVCLPGTCLYLDLASQTGGKRHAIRCAVQSHTHS